MVAIISAAPFAKFTIAARDLVREQQERGSGERSEHDAEIQQRLRRHLPQQPSMGQGARDPARRGDRAENANVGLGEFELVGHEIVERRAKPGGEGIQKQEEGDQVQFRGPERHDETLECAPHFQSIDPAFRLAEEEQRRQDHGYGSNGCHAGGSLQGRKRRQTLNQLTSDKRTRHDGDVEPQPLLADECAAQAIALAVLGKQGAAQGACRGHRE